tara:strand:+ start:176 stop:394 length:219 start_codon:yes stop_codon:yes gene_type:complete
MKLGNKVFLILIFYFIYQNISFSEEKILLTPLLNIDKIKPSFEELEEEKENITSDHNLKEKKKLHSNHHKQF